MTTIQLNNRQELVLVEVPVDAIAIEPTHQGLFYESKGNLVFIDGLPSKYYILGTILPHSDFKIDFDVKEEWVHIVAHSKKVDGQIMGGIEIKLFRNYKYDVPQPVDVTCVSKEQSFQSLLKSELGKVWPLMENVKPQGKDYMHSRQTAFDCWEDYFDKECYESDLKKYNESQSKVMPQKFVAILKEK